MNPENPIPPEAEGEIPKGDKPKEEISDQRKERVPEELKEFWDSLSMEEQMLAEAILLQRPPNEFNAYISHDLAPDKIKQILRINAENEALQLSIYITRGIGTEVGGKEGEPSIKITHNNWSTLGPRGKWHKRWLPIARTLQLKIEAFYSQKE